MVKSVLSREQGKSIKFTQPITVSQPPNTTHHRVNLNPIYLNAAAFTRSTHTDTRLNESTTKQILVRQEKQQKICKKNWHEQR